MMCAGCQEFQVKMYGYNYDELAYWGDRLKEKLWSIVR